MSRTIFSGVIGAAVLLATCLVGQASYGQNCWNNGFGPRNYGYSGNAYSGNYGYQGMYSAGYPSYYSNYSNGGLMLGGYSTGAYGYSTAPAYYGYRPTIGVPYGGYSGIGLNINVGRVPPTSPYYAPLGMHHHHHHGPVHAYRSGW